MEMEKKVSCLKKIYETCQEMMEDGETTDQIIYSLYATCITLMEQIQEEEVDPYYVYGKLNYIHFHAMNDFVEKMNEEAE